MLALALSHIAEAHWWRHEHSENVHMRTNQPYLRIRHTRVLATAGLNDPTLALYRLAHPVDMLEPKLHHIFVGTATPLEEAHRVLECETIIQLGQNDVEFILALLDNPPAPSPRLKEAFRLAQGHVPYSKSSEVQPTKVASW